MRNKQYIAPSEIHSEIIKLWKTDFFKDEQVKHNSFINYIVSELSKQPLIMYDFSDESLEKRHMTPWINHIGRREYDNPYLHDLFLIHEIYHVATLPMKIELDFNIWKQEMWINELYASLSTEVFIYHWYPTLREHTIDQEIWFDILEKRWGLENQSSLTRDIALCRANEYNASLFPPTFRKIVDLRLSLRNGKKAENKPEEWFVRYNNYNSWFEPWKNNFIEAQKIRLQLIKDNNFTKMEESLAKVSEDEIPFKTSIKVYKY